MKRVSVYFPAAMAIISMGVFSLCNTAEAQEEPELISALPGEIPSDAVVLFDGTGLSEWEHPDGSPASWLVEGCAMTVSEGGIRSRKEFGDIQLHLEFRSPSPPKGEGQDRGNSGVYIHGNYEVQILDSYLNPTYSDGQCGAIYKLSPPLVNASRPPGIWQTYDIIFRAARFDGSGNKTADATVTVLHNGILIQDHVKVTPTGGAQGSEELKKGPIFLQDHNHPVSYRNIWVREL